MRNFKCRKIQCRGLLIPSDTNGEEHVIMLEGIQSVFLIIYRRWLESRASSDADVILKEYYGKPICYRHIWKIIRGQRALRTEMGSSLRLEMELHVCLNLRRERSHFDYRREYSVCNCPFTETWRFAPMYTNTTSGVENIREKPKDVMIHNWTYWCCYGYLIFLK